MKLSGEVIQRARVLWLFPLLALLAIPARGQNLPALTGVTINLPAFDYDVIYISDYIDVPTGKINKTIPNFSGSLVANPPGASGVIYLSAEAWMQFKGDAPPGTRLASVMTEKFTLTNQLTLSSADFASGNTGPIQVKTSTSEGQTTLQNKITNSGISTAPVGQYTLRITAYRTSDNAKLGAVEKTIVVRNSSPDEVQINLIDPQPGATVPTTIPTFTWSTASNNVTLYVYRKEPVHRTPQDAITGVPYLKKDLTGVTTYTYPVDAPRRLEQNRSYYWFVEANVTTNRGVETRQSEIRLFRIRTDDPVSRSVDRLLNNLGSNLAGTYSTLQSIGWLPNRVTLDGRTLSAEDLSALAAQLAEQNILSVRVE